MERIINSELDYFLNHLQSTLGEPTQIQVNFFNGKIRLSYSILWGLMIVTNQKVT